MLHEAIELATRAGDRATAITAHRELGFVEVQAGRRTTAENWLAKAQALAETDEELAPILGVRGMNASDHLARKSTPPNDLARRAMSS